MSETVSICWLRRDLRLQDNAALYHALRSGHPVVPVFIFDTNILDDLKEKKDARVHFIYSTLQHLQQELEKHHSTLHVLYGTPEACFKKLLHTYKIASVYTATDYEPYATGRDKQIAALLRKENAAFYSVKDQVIFEKDEVVKDNKEPYTVFTPYSRRWKEKLNDFFLSAYPSTKYLRHLYRQSPHRMPSLPSMGFEETDASFPPAHLNVQLARHYDKTRDYPAQQGTTRLSVHLRFGTISIRELAGEAKQYNATLLNELIWRDFYQMVLWHFPQVVTHSFKPEFDKIRWRNNEEEFKRWCEGNTGFPIVDAGMRELNATGFMHNRVRMITASFLTKDLLIDWRWGEAYFGEKLLDYDLAANNGGWQWSAGTGADAQPFFRIFNPELQTKKFDPQFEYIKKWVPEWQTGKYPQPMVDHAAAKERCLKAYRAAQGK